MSNFVKYNNNNYINIYLSNLLFDLSHRVTFSPCYDITRSEIVVLVMDLKIGRSLKENGFLEADIFNIPHCLSQSPSTISSFSLSLSLFDPSHRVAFSPCVRYDMIRDCRTCNKLENWSKFEGKRISRC